MFLILIPFHEPFINKGVNHIHISRITTQKKDAERYNLYVEDEQGERFACGVHEAVLVRWGLAKGKAITAAELTDMTREDELEKAKKKALQFLSKRMRTEKELRDKLREEDVPAEHIEEVIDTMAEKGYLNDAEYAQTYTRVTMSTTDKGPGRIRQYLQEKGIQDAFINDALEQYDEQKQIETMTGIIAKKAMPRESAVMKKKKLTDVLLRKGFSYSLINAAFEAHDFADRTDEDWQALQFQAEKAASKWRKKYEDEVVKQKLKKHLYQKGFSLSMIDRYLEEEQNE
ncbi:recombination regulator RecX [Natribacillus halophilus]|uniref:Regulatory protein RecX n=1 Tax=Natribacillus halophilus TaxID=549003 RepID=A0A1G8R4N7_9BACI|nr:recombination regulator RecX [Natribacillus halophilus]SDJ11927.1 regulatory protein [Natribacillus halophilus]